MQTYSSSSSTSPPETVSSSTSSVSPTLEHHPSDNRLVDLVATARITTTKFHSSRAAALIVRLLPLADLPVQNDVIQKLGHLLEANPSSERALCQMHVLSSLLRSCPRLPEQVQSSYVQLAAALGGYDISSKEVCLSLSLCLSSFVFAELKLSMLYSLICLFCVLFFLFVQVRLLFDLASILPDPSNFGGEFSAQRCEELQMQMLFLIGRIAERTAPSSYFNFDGVVASLRLAPLDRFPAAKYGYTFCCWLKVNVFFAEV